MFKNSIFKLLLIIAFNNHQQWIIITISIYEKITFSKFDPEVLYFVYIYEPWKTKNINSKVTNKHREHREIYFIILFIPTSLWKIKLQHLLINFFFLHHLLK